MAGAVLDACADRAHKHQFLAPIAHGDARSTLAFVEPTSGWDRAALQLTAKNGRLSGEKLFVPDAGVANTSWSSRATVCTSSMPKRRV